MKTFFLLLISFSFAVKAEVFTYWPDQKTEQKIKMTKLNGMTVNEVCMKEKKACLKIIESVIKNRVEKKTEAGPLGNPASINCEANKGQSEVLRDSKNNEYDFCLLEKKYLVDSWDLMKRK